MIISSILLLYIHIIISTCTLTLLTSDKVVYIRIKKQ